VWLPLGVRASNLSDLWRGLSLPRGRSGVAADQLQQRLVKTGGQLFKYFCCYRLLLAKTQLTRRLFTGILSPPEPAGSTFVGRLST
jgi:hypothetical protein